MNEPKVNTSSFRVVDGELLALKEPLTFAQWRDKYFVSTDHKDIWQSLKTRGRFYATDSLIEFYNLYETCL